MKIMERGQITIPKKLREKYGLQSNTEVEFLPVKDGLLLVKKASVKSPFREVYGILNKNIRTDDYIDEIRGRK